MIKKGDRITFKPEYMDAGDEGLTFVARCDEEKGRLDVSALELQSLSIWPMQTVHVDMIAEVTHA